MGRSPSWRDQSTFQSKQSRRFVGSGFGTIGEIELAYLEMGSLKLRSGFASGDSDSSDGVYSTFTFDRDSNAGSLLFDVHQAAREIAEYSVYRS